MNIAIDVASALHYLHNLCETPVIHCNLKPSNVLLDSDFTAHLSDFGTHSDYFFHIRSFRFLLKLLNKMQFSLTKQSFVIQRFTMFAEYDMGGQVSTQGDVYSYGILLLEMFTGKRTTDEPFRDDLNLHNLVDTALSERLSEVINSFLLTEFTMFAEYDMGGQVSTQGDVYSYGILLLEMFTGKRPTDEPFRDDLNLHNLVDRAFTASSSNHRNKHIECLTSILEIGVACSVESPGDRMDMKDVELGLVSVTEKFIGSRSVNILGAIDGDAIGHWDNATWTGAAGDRRGIFEPEELSGRATGYARSPWVGLTHFKTSTALSALAGTVG
ncbi:unnamed protein product [Ilex paraguariensis]|uniref:non-specific serine/threonine protein kinase n=1 Tax=Ilex paraguariensis TaxID=185542 RepID=A0ABC8UTD9_9AQUA